MEAYSTVTGSSIEILEARESPDFECKIDANIFGIEIVRVGLFHPNDVFWEFTVERRDEINICNFIDLLNEEILKKDEKMNSYDYPHEMILLVVIHQICLDDIKYLLNEEMFPDLFATGFEEIWLGDYKGLGDAYRHIDIYRLYPEHSPSFEAIDRGKPYG